MWVGTAFEMGFAKVRGILMFGDSDVLGPYNECVPVGHSPQRYADGLLIEEFGLQDNLMLCSAAPIIGTPRASRPP